MQDSKIEKVTNVLIVGLPNTGKSHVFNNLTGKYSLVANYHSTTVSAHSALIYFNNKQYRITDVPGFHSLYIHSEDELMVRDLIIRTKPDILIQCIDANQLKQSLHLTVDLMELNIPMVISLNAIDITAKQGKKIDAVNLAHLLGVPVIETIATEGRGTNELKKSLENANRGINKVQYSPQVAHHIYVMDELIPPHIPYRYKATILLLQDDPFILKSNTWIPDTTDKGILRRKVQELKKQFSGSLHKSINHSIAQWVNMVETQVLRTRGSGPNRILEKAAQITRHPIFGFPILILILVVCYLLVVHVAGAIEQFMTILLFNPLSAFLGGLLPAGFWQDMVLGNYGILSFGVFSAIGTVLPVLTIFFFLFGLLEDTGYLPNAGLLIQRNLDKIGLSGKAIMPLILGFGCKTMATLTTKSISSRKERLIAMFLIAFAIPCSAQLGLNMAILGRTGILSFLIATAFLVLVEIAAGIVMNMLIKDDQKSTYIQELPAFKFPNIKGLLKKTGYRILWFLKESFLIFIIAAVVLYFIDLSGILKMIQNFLAPVIIHWLGLPIEMVEGLILTMVRGELAAVYIMELSNRGLLNFVQSIIAVVTTTMFVPCIATIITLLKEAGLRTGIIIILAINVATFILAGLLNSLLVWIF